MPREVRSHIVCVPCWAARANPAHEIWRCVHHKCVCCGFAKMEAALQASKIQETPAETKARHKRVKDTLPYHLGGKPDGEVPHD